MDVYGTWGTIAGNGTVTFGTDFRLSTTDFPPVFAGTLTSNTNIGHYDPVYPPNRVNLHWWYPEWPPGNPEFPEDYTTSGSYKEHVGEYNGLCADSTYMLPRRL